MTGLLSSLELRRRFPQAPITILEASAEAGGTYRTFRDKYNNVFDHGMHLLYETNNDYINHLLYTLLPVTSWLLYSDNLKDVAGAFFEGTLQTYSPYPDLRSLEETIYNKCVVSFFENLALSTPSIGQSAEERLKIRFGTQIYNEVHKKILRSLYGVAPADLHPLVMRLTALDRVCMFDTRVMSELMTISTLRDRVAYPDQVNLPVKRPWNQRALYPRKLGADQIVFALLEQLKTNNIDILYNMQVARIQHGNGRIQAVELKQAGGMSRIEMARHVVWTIGWKPLETVIGGEQMKEREKGTNAKIILVHLAVDLPPEMAPLYYFYCFDAGYATFRVTNYSAYCPDAARENYYPLTVEMWPSRIGLIVNEPQSRELQSLAVAELKHFGVIHEGHSIVFSAVEFTRDRFPLATMSGIEHIETIKSRMMSLFNNLTVIGVMANKEEFYLHDILPHAFESINKIEI